MTNTRDILDCLHGDKYYSSLDCASAYWGVAVDQDDKAKTAFSTPRGHFEMTIMAFGSVYLLRIKTNFFVLFRIKKNILRILDFY